jgi:hypothetical protein
VGWLGPRYSIFYANAPLREAFHGKILQSGDLRSCTWPEPHLARTAVGRDGRVARSCSWSVFSLGALRPSPPDQWHGVRLGSLDPMSFIPRAILGRQGDRAVRSMFGQTLRQLYEVPRQTPHQLLVILMQLDAGEGDDPPLEDESEC